MQRHLLVLLLVLAATLLPPVVCAQSSDWSVVQTLPPGTDLVVVTTHPLHCHLRAADEQGIVCASTFFRMRIDRALIWQVRQSGRHRGAVLGGVIGGALGLGIGIGRNNGTPDGLSTVLGAGIGAALGSIAGSAIAEDQGRLLYLAPATP